MSTLESVVREVEQAIATRDPERRARPLRTVTELFVEQASRLNDHHVSAFDEVIIRVARKVDPEARIELSRRLADIGNAPASVVKDLAQDTDIAVAAPVLERSTRLTEDDLVAVTEQKAQTHLLAVSRRRALSERVADVLVKRGDQRVAQAVANNKGAKLSEWALENLVQKAAGDSDLLSMLMQRPDLPAGGLFVFANVVSKAKAAPRLKPEAIAEMGRIEAALEKLAASMTGPPSGRDISAALERLAKTSGRKAVQEVRVASWIKAEKIDDALAALVHNSGLPASAVVSAYEAPDHEPLLLMVRAARLSWNIFKLLLTARDGKAPPADLVKTSFESFQKLPVISPQELKGLIVERKTAPAVNAA